ncbi:MAG: internal scaffolding protein [Microvirus sp.]|nr:MAG: internal scaffolding protein [Microvirus sp.]
MENIKHIEAKTIIINRLTGEMVDDIPQGADPRNFRIQQDFSDVPSQVDQSQRDENNISVLVKKYAPDELAAYLAAKHGHKQEIMNHDFSQEPDLQESMNIVYRIRSEFEALPDQLQYLFKGKPAEFLKFCENPQNLPQLEAWGLAKKAEQLKNDIKANSNEQSDNASNANVVTAKS